MRTAHRAWVATAVLATTVAVSAVAVSRADAASLFSDDFNDGNASGWSTSGGSWSVSGQNYRQSSTGADAKAQVGTASWTDYTVQARVQPVAFGNSTRAAGITARAQNMTSFYALVLAGSGTAQLRRVSGGGTTTLASAPVSVSTGTWYTLALRVSGSQLTGSVNGTALVSASDTTFATGRIGLVASYTSALFDDVTVESGTGTPPSPSASPGPSPSASPSASPSPSSSPSASPSPSNPSPSTSPSRPPSPSPSTSPGPVPPNQADGFASVNALGQNGTYGGVGGPTVVVDTTAELLAAIDTIGPMVIQVQGTITIDSKRGVRPHKTIVGLGSNAVISGGGFDFYRSYNVIVRNLTFTNAEDDAVNVGQNSHHVWIDHNRFVAPVDGSIDIVRGAEYVTVSWNHFDHTDKSMLIGHSDGSASEDVGHLKVTIHHNFFDHSRQRHPRVRWGDPVHVYNNYFLANELYGVASTQDGGVLLEGNYFQDVPFPCFSAGGYADSGPGRLVQRNNVFVGSGTCEVSGTVADPGTSYAYTVAAPGTVPAAVTAGAGVGRI
ncbi:pectate lyase family protein [Catellatospora paridis]|uniref:pectate lyase family protein n=1 Tax=Catellatospora paridis TaxID=1617086 RepID=UPI0012D3A9D0|nr:family 16 glycoside hydrolase [Catellatospora paridis]